MGAAQAAECSALSEGAAFNDSCDIADESAHEGSLCSGKGEISCENASTDHFVNVSSGNVAAGPSRFKYDASRFIRDEQRADHPDKLAKKPGPKKGILHFLHDVIPGMETFFAADLYLNPWSEAGRFMRESRRLENVAWQHEKNGAFEDAGFFFKQAAEAAIEGIERRGRRDFYDYQTAFTDPRKKLLEGAIHNYRGALEKEETARAKLELMECHILRDHYNSTDRKRFDEYRLAEMLEEAIELAGDDAAKIREEATKFFLPLIEEYAEAGDHRTQACFHELLAIAADGAEARKNRYLLAAETAVKVGAYEAAVKYYLSAAQYEEVSTRKFELAFLAMERVVWNGGLDINDFFENNYKRAKGLMGDEGQLSLLRERTVGLLLAYADHHGDRSNFSSAANGYVFASFIESDPARRMWFNLIAAEARLHVTTENHGANQCFIAAIHEADEDKKMELRLMAAEMLVRKGATSYAAEHYATALGLVNVDHPDYWKIADIAISLAAMHNSCWPKIPEHIKAAHPELDAIVASIWAGLGSGDRDIKRKVEMERAFVRDSEIVLPPALLVRAMEIFRRVYSDVGIIAVRQSQAMDLIHEGVRRWAESGFVEPQGIPAHFLLQTLAVANTDREMAPMRSLLQSKEMRTSNDYRKKVMWFLEDHRADRKSMDQFFRTIEISSASKAVENIGLLMVVRMVDKSFDMDEIRTQEEFRHKAEAVVLSFIRGRPFDQGVKRRFVERVGEFYSSGLFQALHEIYPRYASERDFNEVVGLMDIAVAAIMMGDFHKVKFPTKEGVASMRYLTRGQRALLMKAAGQLDFMSDEMKSKWTKDLKEEMIVEKGIDAAEAVRNAALQRIADMKFHFELHMRACGEKDFAFTDEYLDALRARIAREAKGSTEFQKLKQIERILVSIDAIERMDLANIKKNESEAKRQLNNLANATKMLFAKHYGLSERELASLQAKMDVGELVRLLFEKRKGSKNRRLTASESSDPVHLILAGREPANSGSCQRPDGTAELVIGLSGYVLNSGVKIIRVTNQDDTVVGRAMLKAVKADGKPALLLERAYYVNSLVDPNTDAVIIALAKKKAREMGVPLITTWRSIGEKKAMKVERPDGLSPYEYSDSLGGVRGVGVTATLKVSVL